MDNTTSYNLTSQPPKSGNKKPIVIAVVILAIIAAIGAYLFLNQQNKTNEEKSAVEDSKQLTLTPTPTKKPIDRKTVKIQVLNGTGTPGQASTAKEALVEAGYLEDNIETDNADEYDNTTTTISVKSGFEEVAEDIKKALEADFDEIIIESSPLDEVGDYDVVVTTGGEIYEEATPTKAPTSALQPTTTTPSPSPTGQLTPTLSPSPFPTPTTP